MSDSTTPIQPVRDRTLYRMQEEVSQGHSQRKAIYAELEALLAPILGKPVIVVSLFTSMFWPVVLEDADADMLEEVLQNSDVGAKRLVLVINSPGGDALAAERIVNICRSFSTDGFSVVVPKMAKSAATMVCLGADEILMSRTSELGPIDPQILVMDDRGRRYMPAHEILESYQELTKSANTTKGRPDPYLLQLNRFDDREIKGIQTAQKLSANIAVRCLKQGTMAKLSEAKIKAKIKHFLDPRYSIVHGRPINYSVADKAGLEVKLQGQRDELWRTVWKLYIRLTHVVTQNASKIIESGADSYVAPIPPINSI